MARPDTARYDELLKAVLSIAGEPVSPGVASELLPAWIVEPGNAGHAIHRRERLLAAGAFINAGGAATYATLHASNLSGSNHLAIILKIRCVGFVASSAFNLGVVEPVTASLATGAIVYPRDTRLGDLSVAPPVRGVATRVSYGTPAAPVANLFAVLGTAGAAETVVYDEPIVLAPDSELQVSLTAANAAAGISVDLIEVPVNRFEQ